MKRIIEMLSKCKAVYDAIIYIMAISIGGIGLSIFESADIILATELDYKILEEQALAIEESPELIIRIRM